MSGPARGDGADKPGGPDEMLAYLACPLTGGRLRREGDTLVSENGGVRYPIENGIPVLVRERAILPPGTASMEGFKRTFKP